MKLSLGVILSWLALAFASPALAVPTFDLIAPREVSLTLAGASDASGFTNNGGLWIIATTQTLTLSDFSDVDVTISVDDARIAAAGGILNQLNWTPLSPGQAVAETTLDNDYQSLLQFGESLVFSNPFFWSLDFPRYSDVVGQHVMTFTISVGDQRVSFDSALNLAEGSAFSLNFKGQRLTSASVPEPSTIALLGLGLVGLAAAWRRIQ